MLIKLIAKPIGQAIGRNIVESHEEGKALLDAQLRALSPRQRLLFDGQFGPAARGVGAAYACALLGGSHYLYLGNTAKQVLFWLTAGGFFCWWLLDLVRMYFLVEEANRNTAFEIIKNLPAV